jgi:hypothetical protein
MIDIRKQYNKNFLQMELILSILFAICVIYILNYLKSPDIIAYWLSQNKNNIYSLFASINGTMLGFVFTGMSIILVFTESEKLRRLKRSKHYKTIFIIYFSTIKYLGLATAVPILGIIFNNEYNMYLFYLIIWSIIISVLRIWRCMWVLESLIVISQNRNKNLNDIT